jgi:anthranilate phosphoribosyltransferase
MGNVSTRIIRPEDFGMERVHPQQLAGGDAEANARILLKVLGGEIGPRRDVVLLNSAAAILVGGLAKSFEEGIEMASESIDSGQAIRKLEEFVKATGGSLERVEALRGGS